MTKQSGLGMTGLVGGYDLSGNIGAIDRIGGMVGLLDVTPINASAHVRLQGQRDGQIEFTSYFDNAAGAEHPALSALPTADTQGMVLVPALAVGGAAVAMVSKQVNYDPTRATDGALTVKVSLQGNAYGMEWGTALTAGLRTDTVATNGTSWDSAASASFGAQAYLQVTAFTGTDVTVKIQDSADNNTFADVASLAFAQTTAAHTAQRISIGNTATVRRYIRAVTVTTGGFTSVTFAVMINKNTIAGQVF